LGDDLVERRAASALGDRDPGAFVAPLDGEVVVGAFGRLDGLAARAFEGERDLPQPGELLRIGNIFPRAFFGQGRVEWLDLVMAKVAADLHALHASLPVLDR